MFDVRQGSVLLPHFIMYEKFFFAEMKECSESRTECHRRLDDIVHITDAKGGL